MKYIKFNCLLLVIVLLSLSIIGCGGKDDKVIVAKVNGENINKAEFMDLYNQIKMSYWITEEVENDPEQKEMIKDLKTSILEQMIIEKLIEQKAKEAGFVVTDETLEKARQDFQDIIASIAQQMKEEDEMMQEDEKGKEDIRNKDYTNEAQRYIEDELEAMAYTQEEYIEYVAKQYVIDNFMEDIVKDIQISDDEIQEFYNELLETQTGDAPYIGDGDIELYTPVEVRVKHILIQLPKAEQDEYIGLMAEGDEEEAKKYLEEKLKAIESTAEEALVKAQNGEDFEKLVEEYNADTGMPEEGYIVRQDGQFIPEFEEAAFELREEEVSGLVATGFGYHIIKLYEKRPEKTYTLDEKKDELKDAIGQQKKLEMWGIMVDEWREAAKIKTYESKL